jgi:hypothetical protein
MKRVAIPELLDTDSGSPAEIAASLSDLNRINRWFGGISTTTSIIRRVAQERGMSSLSLLEVAAGSGYVPEKARRKLVRDGIELKVTLLDRAPSHLALVYAGYPLFRSRLTHHDAPASVRQAYTAAEMQGLLKRTSAARVEIHRHYLFRMGVIVWK